ncbi:MAG: MlaD family protein [Maricaulis sp.]|nr:MlaD family protein [Maricaulis sp.]
METKAHHALVGLFAVILVAAGGFFALWLSGVSDREYAQYDVIFDGPVRGLRESSEVRFNGIQVGEVTAIGLDPDIPSRVIARIRVVAETPVRVDSFAQLEPQGLTGLSYVQISGESADAPLLYSPPSQPPPRIFARRTQIDDLFEGTEGVLDSAQIALVRLSSLLSESNVDEISATLANLRSITDRLTAEDQLVDDMRAAIQRIDTAAADISSAAVAMEQFGVTAEAFLVNDMTPAVSETTAAAIAVNVTAVQTNDMLVAIQPSLEAFASEGLEDLTLASADLRRLIDTLERIATEIENDPGSFLAGGSNETVEVPR